MEQLCGSPGFDRDHTIKIYRNGLFKIIQFYGSRLRLGPGPREKQQHHEKKLAASLSRTRRMILEKALCNNWEWFCTFTLDKTKYDRNDLAAWWKECSQWLRDQRKKGYEIKYLFVPELHKDGSWHGHGFFSGIPEQDLIRFSELDKQGYRLPSGRRLPLKLRKSVYYNWPSYQEKFGFCSLGRIRDPVAAGFYITKYIAKEDSNMVSLLGKNVYFPSHNLLVAETFLEFLGRDPLIDELLENKYEFCATGFITFKDFEEQATFLDCLEFFKPIYFNEFTMNEEHEFYPAYVEAEQFYEMDQLKFDF